MHSETIRPFAISAGTIPFLITSITPPSSTLSPFFSFGLLQGISPLGTGDIINQGSIYTGTLFTFAYGAYISFTIINRLIIPPELILPTSG